MSRAIERLFARFSGDGVVSALRQDWQRPELDRVDFHHGVLGFLDRAVARGGDDASLVELQRQVFREFEAQMGARGLDPRHGFIVVIPVADRPRHLQACLNSLLRQCDLFQYGGRAGPYYRKIRVLIADDSENPDNIRRHQELAEQFDQQGLQTLYFGQDEQRRLVRAQGSVPAGILGDGAGAAYHHKGASVMRNVANLKLKQLTASGGRQLCYFIDSDQEFAVHAEGGGSAYIPNYFYHLDRIFSQTDAQVLTGKVVGDPPVSPAVMVGNFLRDVSAFLQRMADTGPDQPCGFHGAKGAKTDDASYHDMADLFGFHPVDEAFHYPCPLTGSHEHRAVFSHFMGQLNGFFDGEHPTRKTLFAASELPDTVTPARTVYTGNYVLKPEALGFFIPFADLKLRMAGPVLGRLIRAKIGPRFVSSNLPMLHRRTLEDMGCSEFRPDIHRQPGAVDLSGEFERQYFGDVMLFTVEQLTESGFPARSLSMEAITQSVRRVETNLRNRYQAKRELNQERLEQLRALADDPGQWWNRLPELATSRGQLQRFIADIENNFGADARGYRLINDPRHRQQRLRSISEAISRYPDDRAAWETLLDLPTP